MRIGEGLVEVVVRLMFFFDWYSLLMRSSEFGHAQIGAVFGEMETGGSAESRVAHRCYLVRR